MGFFKRLFRRNRSSKNHNQTIPTTSNSKSTSNTSSNTIIDTNISSLPSSLSNETLNHSNKEFFELLKKSSIENTEQLDLNGIYVAKVIDAYDGDTCSVAIFRHNEINWVKIRMLGYDSAEMRPKKKDHDSEESRQKEKLQAKKDREYLVNMVVDNYPVTSEEYTDDLFAENNKLIFLEIVDFDKYGKRYLGNLYLEPQPVPADILKIRDNLQLDLKVNDLMVEGGHGYIYDGGTKKKFGE